LRVLQGGLAIARHLSRGHDKVDVMRIISVGIDALCLGSGQISLIDCDRRLIRFYGVMVAANPEESVRSHMDDVPSTWHQSCEEIGMCFSTLRCRRRFGEMDIQVDGARMIGMCGQDTLCRLDSIAYLSLGGRAIHLPVIPRREIHDGVDVEYGYLRIIRKA